jgi:hypothetical protein
MPIALKSTGGGSVTLDVGSTASTFTLTLPNVTGTVATTASPTFSGTVTATTITSPSATALTIQSAGTTAMTVDTSQNVGIGTASPGFKTEIVCGYNNGLQVKDSTATVYGGFFTESAGMALVTRSNHQLRFGTNDTTRMTITSGGNIGLGESAPVTKVQTGGTGANSWVWVNSNANGVSPNASITSGIAFGGNYSAGGSEGNIIYGTYLTFAKWNGTTYTENMRIDSSGRLLIGNTSSFGAGKTCIYYVPGTTVGIAFLPSTDASGPTPCNFLNAAGTSVGSITTTGAATLYNVSSDYRLKNSIVPMTTGLGTIAALKPVTYKWNADNSNGEGFIAHELQAIIPNAVTGEKDAIDADGKPKYQGVDNSKIVVHLVAAIQELKADLDAAKAEIATLKGAA